MFWALLKDVVKVIICHFVLGCFSKSLERFGTRNEDHMGLIAVETFWKGLVSFSGVDRCRRMFAGW